MRRRQLLRSLVVAPCLLAGCAKGAASLRFSGIPDGDKEALKDGYAAVARYLSKALAVRVEPVHVPDYTAAVTSLASGGIDFAWLGGVTTVQAEQRAPAGVHFVAARESDLHFRSYVVANAAVVAQARLSPVSSREAGTLADLAALAGPMRGKRFSFGSKNSTSGHVMPRAFLSDSAVGIDPETHFSGGPLYQRQGGHAATLRAVASGAVDFGVLNFASWERAEAELQAKAPVVAVTPEYVDYCLVARGTMPQAQVHALRAAFVGLDAEVPEQAAVLDAFAAKRFVEVDASAWSSIRAVLTRLEAEGALR
ncbi:MAG: PhnD/SsuA/transferrin family substrate-binding protein [Nannocystaceae bacterium]|nr:PhnD/SsuA/transferrin family substrate-binding protein [Nannocystaceae bacterium]